jgi:uroporphyrinogen-III synthase
MTSLRVASACSYIPTIPMSGFSNSSEMLGRSRIQFFLTSMPLKLTSMPLKRTTEMAAGRIDAIAFTSAPQVRRFRDVARASGREAELRQGFERMVVAAVGPIVATELEALGIQVNVKPQGDTFFMKPLVRELAAALMKE